MSQSQAVSSAPPSPLRHPLMSSGRRPSTTLLKPPYVRQGRAWSIRSNDLAGNQRVLIDAVDGTEPMISIGDDDPFSRGAAHKQ
jgi:hypothetical protein